VQSIFLSVALSIVLGVGVVSRFCARASIVLSVALSIVVAGNTATLAGDAGIACSVCATGSAGGVDAMVPLPLVT